MPKGIFISLPVADVAAAATFYEALGFARNAAFSTPQGASMQWSDAIGVMLLDHALFATFSPKRMIDARTQIGALLALSFDTRAEVDAITRAAVSAGGRALHDAEDLGFMYSRAFEDLDGHGWGPFHMDLGEQA